MPSLIPTRSTLRQEVEDEFSLLVVEMVHCSRCGEYHPPDLHLAPFSAFEEDDEPAEA